jgi:hypothetical protein
MRAELATGGHRHAPRRPCSCAVARTMQSQEERILFSRTGAGWVVFFLGGLYRAGHARRGTSSPPTYGYGVYVSVDGLTDGAIADLRRRENKLTMYM